MDPRFREYEVKKLRSPACSRQENAMFSLHIHGIWGSPFRPSLYRNVLKGGPHWFREIEEEILRCPAYCRQENATVSPHIHRTWGSPFRPSLYRPFFSALCSSINKIEKLSETGRLGEDRMSDCAFRNGNRKQHKVRRGNNRISDCRPKTYGDGFGSLIL